MAKTEHSISVFFPCYNDYKCIGTLVEEVILVLKGVTEKFEVIVWELSLLWLELMIVDKASKAFYDEENWLDEHKKILSELFSYPKDIIREVLVFNK